MKITVMRSLRIKHGILLREFAHAAGVSSQYISKVELGIAHGQNLKMVQRSFEILIAEKNNQLNELMKSYSDNKDRLLEIDTKEG